MSNSKELTTEEGNCIIAVYMNGRLREDSFTKATYFLNLPFGHHCYTHKLPFAESFDALMPVIAKLMANLELHEGGTSRDIQAQIRHKIQTVYKDITPLYKETVRGIEYINQVRKLNN